MSKDNLEETLERLAGRWLVTGVAGFIGSNLLEKLLSLGQEVVGFDNLSTGHLHNLDAMRDSVSPDRWKKFHFIEGDLRDLDACAEAVAGVDYVLHQAALGSVPRSIKDPVGTHESNVSGFVNILTASKDAGVRRFVYASSSSVYGDHPGLPKVEGKTGKPLSPYAATKCMDEIYADVFSRSYGIETIGLRYFNIFGKRQDPEGAYAAVIPLWFKSLLKGEPVYINGDGETSRDFCYVDNAVQANLLAAMSDNKDAVNKVYNVAVGERNTLNKLFDLICAEIRKSNPDFKAQEPVYRDFRPGDVRHSLADISKAKALLGYEPTHKLAGGLSEAVDYYLSLFRD